MKVIVTLFIFLNLSEFTYSQSGQWTWMKGDTTFYKSSHKTQWKVEDSSFHPAALYLASSWVDDQGRLWLFGGTNYSQFNYSVFYSDNIWRYNPATNDWACMKSSQFINSLGEYGTLGESDTLNYPSGRTVAGLWKDTSGMIWMFGGVNGFGAWNDMWKYDMNTNSWTWVKGPDSWNVAGHYGTQGVAAPGNNPPPRGESACWIDDNNDLWLFGGYWINTSVGWEFYNDLWRYRIATNMWTWMGGSKYADQDGSNGIKGIPSISNLPRSRSCNCSWTDTAGNFYLFGGSTVYPLEDQFDDVWRYNPNTSEWTWVSGLNATNSSGYMDQYCQYNVQNLPLSRAQSACVKLNNDEVVIIGGHLEWGGLHRFTRDVWKYKISSNEWEIIWGDSLTYPGNYGTQGVYSPSNDLRGRTGAIGWKGNENTIWIYGGDYGIDYKSESDLWRYALDSNCLIFSTSPEISDDNSEIIIYPNPAIDQINIKCPACKSFPATLIIKSSLGIQLLKKQIKADDAKVNIASLSSGLYFIEIITHDFRKVFKLIKQ